MVAIEKNIPLPDGKSVHKYPWHDMAVGDSFKLTPIPKSDSTAYNIAKASSYRLAPKKFKGGKDAVGVWRVWRIA